MSRIDTKLGAQPTAKGEQEFVAGGPDLLQDLFDNYVAADLLVAGASEDAVRRLLDASGPDLAGRLKGVRGSPGTVQAGRSRQWDVVSRGNAGR